MKYPRQTVRNSKEFIRWACAAERGDSVTYHIGNLASDRADAAVLHQLAETVMILMETGYVTIQQVTMRLPINSPTWYSVVRTGTGWAPRSIIFEDCEPTTYRALQALKIRDADQSAARAVRDAIGCPESLALDLLALLYARKWIEPAEPKGWQLSGDGLRMLT
jgi:hypothetical protein